MKSKKIRLNLKKAIYLQSLLGKRVIKEDKFKTPLENAAGVDVAYLMGYGIGTAVLINYETLEPIERQYSIVKIDIPYIPTFLAFREIPPIIKAIKKLSKYPDIVLIDAHGIMHPRKFGAASHIGVVLDMPTIGVAKSRLVGDVDKDGYIYYKKKIVGYRLGKKIYVSIGHRVSLTSAIKIVSNLTVHRIPEPTRLAHNYANEIKRDMKKNLDKYMKM